MSLLSHWVKFPQRFQRMSLLLCQLLCLRQYLQRFQVMSLRTCRPSAVPSPKPSAFSTAALQEITVTVVLRILDTVIALLGISNLHVAGKEKGLRHAIGHRHGYDEGVGRQGALEDGLVDVEQVQQVSVEDTNDEDTKLMTRRMAERRLIALRSITRSRSPRHSLRYRHAIGDLICDRLHLLCTSVLENGRVIIFTCAKHVFSLFSTMIRSTSPHSVSVLKAPYSHRQYPSESNSSFFPSPLYASISYLSVFVRLDH